MENSKISQFLGPLQAEGYTGDDVEQLLKTPLFDEHVALGGRMVEFAGYSMPVQYKSVIAESKAVRESAGMFDVSHMARLELRGPRTLEFLEQVTTNDVGQLKDGEGHYSLLPNADGGLVDDIIVYRMAPEEFRMVVNASNHAKDVDHLNSQNTYGVEITDVTTETAMIAVQGPKAVEIVASLSDDPEGVKSGGFFDVRFSNVAGVHCFSPRSGYTGEDGFELICAAEDASRLWIALLDAGVEPCGLGSRDTLRVEAGLPLYGHELGDDRSPLDAGLGWVISKTKSFLGSEEIYRVRAEGAKHRLMGLKMTAKRLTQPGMEVYADGAKVGEISSGVVSPLLDCGLAFAFLIPSVKIGDRVEIEIRGKREPAEVVNKRFFKRA